jgi:3-deoxy-D-manno-octulosonic-acid transferase/heptosyltransferase-1
VNILIVKLSAIGDVIHTLPSLRELRKLYPDAHITWVIEEASADLIKDHPDLDRILISPRKRWIQEFKGGQIHRPTGEIRAWIKALRERSYDLVIDFHGLFKSAIIVFLSDGKRKLGYDSMQELSGLFYNDKIREDMEKHAVDRYLDFPRYLGANVGTPEFPIAIQAQNEKHIAELLKTHGMNEADVFVAISPIALWETKLWENERFARLGDRLNEELGMKVILSGGERKTLDDIQSQMRTPCINLGGQTTLRDLACLYRRAWLVISTDSGPMHLAAAVGTPVIALFGPTNPQRTGPYGKKHIVIQKALSCSPCLLKKCDSMQCMRDINVDEVFEAVRKKLVG